MLSHVLIFHGRRTCHAKKPACGACPVARLCPSYGIGETDPVKAAKLLKFELAPGATNPYAVPTPLPGSPTAGARPEPRAVTRTAGRGPSRWLDRARDGDRGCRPRATSRRSPHPRRAVGAPA